MIQQTNLNVISALILPRLLPLTLSWVLQCALRSFLTKCSYLHCKPGHRIMI